jgi:hypothetical protein
MKPEYTSDRRRSEILYECLRHKVAHLAYPYAVFDTTTARSKTFDGQPRRRVTWSVHETERRPAIEIIDYSTPERLVKTPTPWPVSDLRRRIFHQPLSRLQPSRAVPVPVSLARLRTVLVVLSTNRVAGFAFQRLFHDQPRCQLDQRILGRTCGQPAFNQRRQLFTRTLRSGYPRRHGVLLCRARQSPFDESDLQRMHPAIFPATAGLHLQEVSLRPIDWLKGRRFNRPVIAAWHSVSL